jgi:DNA-binding FrmR family transcriptional regulator
MAHVHKHRKQLLTRVRASAARWRHWSRRGQAGGEAGDCADVLVQVAAVRGAAHSLLMELLHEHLQEHVVGAEDPQQRAAEAGCWSSCCAATANDRVVPAAGRHCRLLPAFMVAGSGRTTRAGAARSRYAWRPAAGCR